VKFFFNGLIAAGILFGIVIVIFFEISTDFFGESIEPSGELVAALLGASIGWAGTVLTIHASIEAKQNEQLSRDQAVSAEIFVKFQTILNGLYHFRKHIRECFAAADPSMYKNPSSFVLALAGHPDPIRFTPEEKALYIRLKKLAAANDVAEWDEIYNSLVRAFEKYAQLRDSLLTMMPATMEGNIGTSTFKGEEFKKVAPTIAQLDHLVEQLRSRCEKDYAECGPALLRAKAEMEALCGMTINLELPD
jgi:hypothetical protein